MPRYLQYFIILGLFSASAIYAQHLCPRFMLTTPMKVSIEGHFVNVQQNRASIDIEWRHHPDALDSFLVSFPNRKPFTYVTAGEYRYIEYTSPKVKRQLGQHHLRESIGDTPLKLDDFELLANGAFLCLDTAKHSQQVLIPAFSNTWWSLIADSLPTPQTLTMRGAHKEIRTFNIGSWTNYSGASLPTLVSLSGPKYYGNLWIRSVSPIVQKTNDPLLERAFKNNHKTSLLFRKVPMSGKREIPLILKLNQEFLRD